MIYEYLIYKLKKYIKVLNVFMFTKHMVTQYAENVEFILEQTINFVIAARFLVWKYIWKCKR